MPTILSPIITDAGLAAAIAANGLGLQLAITHVALGTGQYTPVESLTALAARKEKTTVSAGLVTPAGGFRLNALFSAWTGAPNPYNATELGFYAGDPDAGGVLFAVYSHPTSVLVTRNSLDYIAQFALQLNRVPAGSVTVTIDPSGAQSLALMAAHEASLNPHPGLNAVFVKRSNGIEFWDATVNYLTQARVVNPFDNRIYRALAGNTNKQPNLNPAEWALGIDGALATTGAVVAAATTLTAAQLAQDFVDINTLPGTFIVTIPDPATWPKNQLTVQWVSGDASPTLALAAGNFAAGTVQAIGSIQFPGSKPTVGFAQSLTLVAISGGVRII